MLTRFKGLGYTSAALLLMVILFGSTSLLRECEECGHAYAAWTNRAQKVFEVKEGQRVASANRSISLLDCPSPYSVTLNAPTTLPLDRDACRPLVSVKKAFKAAICPLPGATTCNSLSIVIARKDGAHCRDVASRTESSAISADKNEAAFVKRVLGPDGFEVTIDGTERLAMSWPTSYSEELCESRFDFRLSNAGAFNISIAHMYADYQGFSELWEDQVGPFQGKEWPEKGRVPAWPRLIDETVSKSSSLDIDAPIGCPLSCSAYHLDDKARVESKASADLPICSRTDAVQPVYLEDASSKGYAATPRGCRWSADEISLLDVNAPLSLREHCLGRKKRRVVLQGDSHARMIFDAMQPRVLGSADEPVYEKDKHKFFTAWQTEFEFVWDERALHAAADKVSPGSDQEPSKADILILTTGAHQAFLHWPSWRFFGLMKNLASVARKRRKAKLPTIFLSHPAYPPKKVRYVFDSRDWRTNYRLANWSIHSLEQMHRAGAMVMDGFTTTEPMHRLSPDLVHYRDTPAIEYFLQEMFHKMALCQD